MSRKDQESVAPESNGGPSRYRRVTGNLVDILYRSSVYVNIQIPRLSGVNFALEDEE
jgi:hypothetical protein